jgi:stearoyl-CoA desaturase (delta-9 desaturase)
MGAMTSFWIVPLAAVNGLGHWRGAQNFSNTAYNSPVLAWVTAGESLHNNHHAHPRSPKFSVRRLEFDHPVSGEQRRRGALRSAR